MTTSTRHGSVADRTLFTIGHSTRSFEEFATLLHEHRITRLVDVRKIRGSNRYPQFNEAALTESLAREGIAYAHCTELAGRRTVSRTVPFETNAWWRNRSFHNYADYAYDSAEFNAAVVRTVDLSSRERTAIMCSEAVWWRCHRRIIADYLIGRGLSVTHILGPDQTSAATLSTGAELQAEHRIVYPATTAAASAPASDSGSGPEGN